MYVLRTMMVSVSSENITTFFSLSEPALGKKRGVFFLQSSFECSAYLGKGKAIFLISLQPISHIKRAGKFNKFSVLFSISFSSVFIVAVGTRTTYKRRDKIGGCFLELNDAVCGLKVMPIFFQFPTNGSEKALNCLLIHAD